MGTLLRDYLERLPRGLDSHPECTARAEPYREIWDRVPPPQRDAQVGLAWERYAGESWVPEVLASATTLCQRDSLDDDDAFLRWCYAINVDLFRGPLLRGLMRVLSPTLVVMGGARRWGVLHRGTELQVVRWRDPRRARDDARRTVAVELRHPPHLFSPLHHRQYAEGIRAGMHVAGATDAEIEVASHPGRAEYRGSYRV